ncbi:proline--tRNA ligase [Saccharibacillus sp. CPCC 101409]|uniref:proline--tRNA ligase n=1 Tax=Saccharibacillus sp. CPCC 101409 TaxID=3058041 RepID=UPI00267209C2|nr:proline--tRNA ligase [Saccharibacillus sp. CPCC 101409]MDO3411270.1 proline--tRNA ligase [Saccharibacillus sp. CPCC 101409]
MKQSQLLIPTLREAPADAEAVSHKLMLRAGLIRQLASGVYTYLPLGFRVLKKVQEIVREEMDRAGAQELLMPAMQPAELWKESGRYDVYGPELVRLKDRHDREFALGPTHEEVITSLVADEISSYRQLPLTLYQIQTKFRDERRPRFGLLRGREFLMKDAYSFGRSWEELDETYRAMYEAYTRIFTRVGLDFRAVQADAGAIGGEGETHEFMALAEIGEDTIVVSENGTYAANLEKAEMFWEPPAGSGEEAPPMNRVHTPGAHSIDQLREHFGLEASAFIKTMLYLVDDRPVAVVVRGDREVNETKVQNALGGERIELADDAAVRRLTGAEVGFAGPAGLEGVKVLVDREAAAMPSAIAGANETDYHVENVKPDRDFAADLVGDYRNAAEGDLSPDGSGPLKFYRGIEVGHVFKLGTKYSEKLGAAYLDDSGRRRTAIMGCYGIGISRILSAVVEQNYDENGIRWPEEIAPAAVHIVPASAKDAAQMELALELYERFRAAGVDVLLDDRDERAGVKFKDADLLGIPHRIVVGREAAEKRVEFKKRSDADKETLTADEAFDRIAKRN